LGFSVKSNIQQTPLLIQGVKNIIDVACGNDHALALDNKGKVWAWGGSQQNQLGRKVLERNRIQALTPREVEIPRKWKVKSVHSGSFHSFAVTTNGSVFSWGLNSFSQCGMYTEEKDDSTNLVPVPTLVPALEQQDIVMIDGGDQHSIALSRNGDLLAWGNMTAHQVGVGLDKVPTDHVILDESGKPRCLIVPSKIADTKFNSIAAGSNHNIAIGTDGAAYSWGFGDQYQCGHGEPGQDVKVPSKIVNTATTGVEMVAAACGGQITVLAGIPEGVNPPRDRSSSLSSVPEEF
jgi:regulator of chromosome condensation